MVDMFVPGNRAAFREARQLLREAATALARAGVADPWNDSASAVVVEALAEATP